MQAEYEIDLVRTWELPQRRDEMTSLATMECNLADEMNEIVL